MLKHETEFSFIVPVVKRGNLGKSTCLTLLGSWLEQREVPWQGFDFDPDHASFSRIFPERVRLISPGLEPEGDWIGVSRQAQAAPVTLVDPRAHLSQYLLQAWEMIQFPETFVAAGGRITVLLFPADDLEVMADMDGVVSQLQNRVQYLVVRNPARSPRTRMFDGSELERELVALGAHFLEVAPLLSLARNHLAALEAELGRGVGPLEAAANHELPLDGMVRLVIDDWVRTFFRRMDGLAGQVLPSAYARKITSVDKGTKEKPRAVVRGAKINRSNL